MNDPVQNNGDDRRNMPRWTIGEEATLRTEGGQHTCWLQDVSASGVKFRCDTTVAVGDEVRLRLRGEQPLHLRVVRVGSDHVAAAFVDGPEYFFR